MPTPEYVDPLHLARQAFRRSPLAHRRSGSLPRHIDPDRLLELPFREIGSLITTRLQELWPDQRYFKLWLPTTARQVEDWALIAAWVIQFTDSLEDEQNRRIRDRCP